MLRFLILGLYLNLVGHLFLGLGCLGPAHVQNGKKALYKKSFGCVALSQASSIGNDKGDTFWVCTVFNIPPCLPAPNYQQNTSRLPHPHSYLNTFIIHTSLLLSQWENTSNYVKYNLIALSRVPVVHLLLDIGIPAH